MDITVELVKYLSIDNLVFIIIACIGMIGHAVKKYLAGQLSGSIFQYLFTKNPKRSAMAVMTTLGACFALILGDQLPTQAGAFIMLAFTTGFTADSSVNKEEE